MNAASVACPAKVNLFLRILAREASGHHQIETALQAVSLADRIEVRRSAEAGISLRVRRPGPGSGFGSGTGDDLIGDLGDPGANTVVRAARAFHAAAGIPPAAAITLHKVIPAGTGLGGGSSDAAGTLAALNALHGRPLEPGELAAIGGRIGADVPFFCCGSGLALAWGRGDRLLPLAPLPRVRIVLVFFADRIATGPAYRETSASLSLPAGASVLPALTAGDWSEWTSVQHNDFEATVFGRHPALAAARAALEDEGALIARLTGSGSTVFGVFERAGAAVAAAERVRTMAGVAAAAVAETLRDVATPVAGAAEAPGPSS